jgi:flagellar M-ring protein FliF
MDFLSKAMQQVRELYEGMTPSARIVTGVLTLAIMVSLVFLFRIEAVGGDAYLYGGQEFSQSDLAAMMTALGEAGLNDAEIKGNRLQVPRSQQAAYISAIAKGGATPKSGKTLDDPAFSGNPFDTRTQQEAREKARKQLKIATMLEELKNLESVAVEYDETRKNNFSRELVRSALITAKAVGSKPLTESEIRTIQRSVMMAVGSIAPENIVVVDKVTGISTVGIPQDDISDPANNRYATTKKYYEDMWREKIISRIQPTYGATNVQVNVELDDTLAYIEQSKELGTPAVLRSETEKETSESVRGEPGGRPGVVPNTGGANSASSVSSVQGSSSQSTKNRESSESRVGGSITQVEKAKLVPKEVSVSIGIPESYYHALWRLRNKTADGSEPAEMTPTDMETLLPIVKGEVQSIVQPLILVPKTGEDIFDHITVMPDYELPETPVELPTYTDHAFSWLAANWQTLGMILLGFAGLVVMRGMVKSTSSPQGDAPEQAASEEEHQLRVAAGTEESEAAPAKTKRRFSTDGPNIKDELSELIQDDPDTAANVLKQWIGEAA